MLGSRAASATREPRPPQRPASCRRGVGSSQATPVRIATARSCPDRTTKPTRPKLWVRHMVLHPRGTPRRLHHPRQQAIGLSAVLSKTYVCALHRLAQPLPLGPCPCIGSGSGRPTWPILLRMFLRRRIRRTTLGPFPLILVSLGCLGHPLSVLSDVERVSCTIRADSALYSPRFGPGKLLDGNRSDPESRWASARSALPHWVRIDIAQPVKVDRVVVYGHAEEDLSLTDACVQILRYGRWIDVAAIRGNRRARVPFDFEHTEATVKRTTGLTEPRPASEDCPVCP